MTDPHLSKRAEKSTAISMLKVAILASSFFIIFTYPISLLLGVYVMYMPQLGLSYLRHSTQIYLISYMIALPIPFKVSRAALFAVLITIYLIFLIASAKLDRSVIEALHRSWRDISSLSGNWLLYMPMVSGMLLILIAALQSLQEFVGIPTGAISFPNPYGGLLSLAYSPIMEEIGFRLTPIGTVTAIYLARYGKPLNALLSVLWPDKGKERQGLSTIRKDGFRAITKPEWIAIAVSSLLFGLIHYIAGGGWNIGKISSAAVAGTALALIYLWKGIHASILLHWFFNYYSYVWDIAGMVDFQLFAGLNAPIYMLTLFLGFLGWIHLLLRTYRRLRRGSDLIILKSAK